MKPILAALLLTVCSCDLPLTLAVEGKNGVYSYSAKDGIKAMMLIREEKSGPITPQEIADRYRP